MEDKAKRIRQLFLIDAIGAATSALLLWLIIARFPQLFGVPLFWIRWLSRIAVGYSAYSFLCYLIHPRLGGKFLKIIAIANIIYSALILLMIVTNFGSLSWLGVLYFVIEIGIIGYLAWREFKMAKNIQRQY